MLPNEKQRAEIAKDYLGPKLPKTADLKILLPLLFAIHSITQPTPVAAQSPRDCSKFTTKPISVEIVGSNVALLPTPPEKEATTLPTTGPGSQRTIILESTDGHITTRDFMSGREIGNGEKGIKPVNKVLFDQQHKELTEWMKACGYAVPDSESDQSWAAITGSLIAVSSLIGGAIYLRYKYSRRSHTERSGEESDSQEPYVYEETIWEKNIRHLANNGLEAKFFVEEIQERINAGKFKPDPDGSIFPLYKIACKMAWTRGMDYGTILDRLTLIENEVSYIQKNVSGLDAQSNLHDTVLSEVTRQVADVVSGQEDLKKIVEYIERRVDFLDAFAVTQQG